MCICALSLSLIHTNTHTRHTPLLLRQIALFRYMLFFIRNYSVFSPLNLVCNQYSYIISQLRFSKPRLNIKKRL